MQAQQLVHLLRLYVLISKDQTQLPTRQKESLCRVCERRHPAAKQHIAFFDQEKMKVWQNTVKFLWVLMYSSFYRISLITRIFQALFCSTAPTFPLQDQTCGSAVCLFHTAAPSFKSYVWAKTDSVECDCCVKNVHGTTRMRVQERSFIWRKFIHCKAYHNKIHVYRTKKRGEGQILRLDFTSVHTSFWFFFPLAFPCVCRLSLSLFPLWHLPDF